jgi:hypothetical protein
MKYLLFTLLVLTGCTPELTLTFKPSLTEPRHRECTELVGLGWIESQVDYNGCVKHLTKPKYKKAQILKIKDIKDSVYANHCTFEVTGLVWAYGMVKNKPYYKGNVKCKTLNFEDTFPEWEVTLIPF